MESGDSNPRLELPQFPSQPRVVKVRGFRVISVPRSRSVFRQETPFGQPSNNYRIGSDDIRVSIEDTPRTLIVPERFPPAPDLTS